MLKLYIEILTHVVSYNELNYVCVAYRMGKSHQLPLIPSTTEYHALLDLIFPNIWGPTPMPYVHMCLLVNESWA